MEERRKEVNARESLQEDYPTPEQRHREVNQAFVILILSCVCICFCTLGAVKWKDRALRATTEQQLFDMETKCDFCGTTTVYKNKPSGFSVEMVEIDGCWFNVCSRCLGRIWYLLTNEQFTKAEKIREKYKVDTE